MSDFAVPEAACRAAVEELSGRLPPGFIGEDWYKAWLDLMRSGDAFGWRTRRDLAAFLPAADQWPELAPICSRDADEPPADLFLRSASSLALEIARAGRAALTADALPWRRFVTVDDSRTCAEHRALHGAVRRVDDPFWAQIEAEFRWGCRCTSTTMNARTAQRRGYALPG